MCLFGGTFHNLKWTSSACTGSLVPWALLHPTVRGQRAVPWTYSCPRRSFTGLSAESLHIAVVLASLPGLRRQNRYESPCCARSGDLLNLLLANSGDPRGQGSGRSSSSSLGRHASMLTAADSIGDVDIDACEVLYYPVNILSRQLVANAFDAMEPEAVAALQGPLFFFFLKGLQGHLLWWNLAKQGMVRKNRGDLITWRGWTVSRVLCVVSFCSHKARPSRWTRYASFPLD